MQQDYFEQWKSFTQLGNQPWQGFSAVTQETFAKLAKDNMNAMNEYVSNNIAFMQNLARVKQPDEFVETQTKAWQESGKKFVDHAQRNLETLVKASNDYGKLVSQTMQQASNMTAADAKKSEKK